MRLLLLTCFWWAFTSVSAQSPLPVHLKSGDYLPSPIGVSPNAKYQRFVIIQFRALPDADQFFLKTGIKLLDYLPQNSFYAVLPEGIDLSTVQPEVTGILAITPEMKIDRASWANRSVEQIKLVYFEEAGLVSVLETLKQKGFEVTHFYKNFQTIFIKAKPDITEILKMEGIYWAEPAYGELEAFNLVERNNHRTNVISANSNPGKGLTGAGINIGIWDGGEVGSHEDFNSRLTLVKKKNVISSHATHVCGTMAAAGNIDPAGKGMAPKVGIYSWDFYNDITAEMDTNYSKLGYTLTQNSYAYSPSYDPCAIRGSYDLTSRELDLIVEKYPNLLHVFAAGNSRGNNCKPNGFKTVISGFQCSKNTMAVAAVTNLDGDASFSSCGPTRDGRLKPEVSAVGVDVFSTLNLNIYQGGWNGTSMACPGASGTTALIYEYYKKKNGKLPDAHLAKNLMANSADDIGNAGPDFRYGFGRINAARAIKLIDLGAIKTDSVKNNRTDNDTLKLPKGVFKIKIMLCWNDKAATASSKPSLINDLDLLITDSLGTLYKPWVLDTNSCDAAALRGRDSLNNIEQVTIENPASGNLIITVKGKRVTTAFQNYSLTWDVVNTGVNVTFPNGQESFPPPSSGTVAQTIRWDAYNLTGNAKIDYSEDNGKTWQTIVGAVAVNQKYYAWNSASDTINTSKALIRISAGIYTDQSDTTFTIYKIPTAPIVGIICDSQVHFKWPVQKDAIAYKLWQIKDGEMKPIYNGSDTFFTVRKLNNGQAYWFSLSSISKTGGESQRMIAKSFTPNNTIKPPKITRELNDTAGCKNSTLVLNSTVAGTGSITNYWERSTNKGAKWNTLSGRITDTLILQNLKFSNNDWRYRRVYENVCEGKVYTWAAKVEVDTVIPFFTIPKDTLGCTGGSLTLKLHNIKSVSKPFIHWLSVCNTSGSTGTTKRSKEPFLELQNLSFAQAKNYPVSATNSCGTYCPNTGCCGIQLTVSAKLTLDLKDNDTICLGQSYTIKPGVNDGNPNLYKYKWTGPDTVACSKNLKIKPDTLSRYFIELNDQECTPGTLYDSIDIFVRDSLKLSVSRDTTICFGTKATLAARATGGNRKYTFIWNHGLKNGAKQIVYPTKTTVYYISLTDSCSSEILRDSIIVNVKPSLKMTLTARDDTICIGQSTTLKVRPAGGTGKDYSLLWNTNQTDSVIMVSPITSTFYSVTLGDKCSYPFIKDSIKVNVRPFLSLKLTAPDTVCHNIPFIINSNSTGGNKTKHTISWQRHNTKGNVSTDSTKLNNWVKATLTDNCTTLPSTDSVWVKVWSLPNITAARDTTLCYGQNHSFQFSNSGGRNGTINTWWQFNKAIINSRELSINPMVAGNYKYIAVIKDGCGFITTDTTDIMVLEKLKVTPLTIQKCSYRDSFITFKTSGGIQSTTQLNWLDGQTGPTISFKEKKTKVHSVIVSDGCSDTAIYNINAVVDEFGTNEFGVSVINDKTVTLMPSIPLIEDQLWNFGDNQTMSFANTPSSLDHQFKDYGKYSICRTLTDKIGCENVFCKELNVIDVTKTSKFKLKITPNPNDGNFQLSFNEVPGNMSLEIFNSIGQPVFKQSYNTLKYNTNSDKLYTITMGTVSPGIYMLKVNANNEILFEKIQIK